MDRKRPTMRDADWIRTAKSLRRSDDSDPTQSAATPAGFRLMDSELSRTHLDKGTHPNPPPIRSPKHNSILKHTGSESDKNKSSPQSSPKHKHPPRPNSPSKTNTNAKGNPNKPSNANANAKGKGNPNPPRKSLYSNKHFIHTDAHANNTLNEVDRMGASDAMEDLIDLTSSRSPSPTKSTRAHSRPPIAHQDARPRPGSSMSTTRTGCMGCKHTEHSSTATSVPSDCSEYSLDYTTSATSIPATSKRATNIPVTSLPATSKPAVSKPATSIPATSMPATSIPSTNLLCKPTAHTSTVPARKQAHTSRVLDIVGGVPPPQCEQRIDEERVLHLLLHTFGHADFRSPLQRDAVFALLKGTGVTFHSCILPLPSRA